MSVAPDEADQNPEDFEFSFRANDRECLVVGLQDELTAFRGKFLQGEFVVDDSHDEVTRPGGNTARDAPLRFLPRPTRRQ